MSDLLEAERADVARRIVNAARAEATIETSRMLAAVEHAADDFAPGWRSD